MTPTDCGSSHLSSQPSQLRMKGRLQLRNERFEMSPLCLAVSLPKRCPLPIGFVSARKSAVHYQADTTTWHPGFAELFPHRYLIKQSNTYVVPGMRRRLVL